MSQTMMWIDMDTVIAQYIDVAELSIHKQVKLKQIFYRGVEHMGIDAFYKIQSMLVPVNPNFTVNLPANCIKLIKAGVLNGQGGVIALKKDNNLTTYADYLSTRVQTIQDNAVFNWNQQCDNTWWNFWTGTAYINYYGVPSGAPFVGTYTVDERAGLVVLGANFNSMFPNILIECLVGEDMSQPIQIPIQFKEAMIAYLAWQDIAYLPNSRRGGISDKRDRERTYKNERRLAIARFKPFDMNDANQMSLMNNRLTIKG